MRVMIMIKSNERTEAGAMPSERLLADMQDFNEELARAGVLLAGEGLHPSAEGVRVTLSGEDATLTEGPFPDPTGLVAGFWLWRVASVEEAIEWVKRMPRDPSDPGGQGVIEIRPMFEAEDFGEELTPELRAREERLRHGQAAA
jgi:hypothetical protein